MNVALHNLRALLLREQVSNRNAIDSANRTLAVLHGQRETIQLFLDKAEAEMDEEKRRQELGRVDAAGQDVQPSAAVAPDPRD